MAGRGANPCGWAQASTPTKSTDVTLQHKEEHSEYNPSNHPVPHRLAMDTHERFFLGANEDAGDEGPTRLRRALDVSQQNLKGFGAFPAKRLDS